MGHKAGYGTYLNAYSNNVFIGAESGYSVVSGSNNVFIGYQAGYNETGGNKLYIESTSGDKDDALIYGDFSTDDLQLNGNVRIANWTNAVSQTGLSIDVDGESTDTILKLRSNTTAGSWTDTDIKMVVYGDGSVYMPEVYVDNFSTGRDLYIASDGQLGYISSSKRYKEQITNMEDVGWIHQLRPVNFVYKKDERKQKQYGLIAEEVENVNREFVSYNKDGMVETVHYDKFISVLIKIVQEQDKKIENQQIENKSLQEELHLLKEQIEEINQLLSR
jgi:hypothetical protein